MVTKVSHTVFHEMAPLASWEQFAERFPGATHLLEAQRNLGLEVSWIAPSAVSREFMKDGIKVRLVRAPRLSQSRCVARAINEQNPEVIHLHGLNSWMGLRFLSKSAREHAARCIVQDHGGGIPALSIRRRMYRRSLATVRCAVFGDSDTRDRWIDGHLLTKDQCRILFAASSTFQPANDSERDQIRRRLQMEGRPILGWVAHLDANKDPLTILRAAAMYFEKNPEARLYMHFIKDDLRNACEATITADPALRQRVFLRGKISHLQLESFYRAIDYFLQGSHHEAYGYSIVEAMSTGAIPIVTDIPSFRLVCDEGRCGFLFRPGDVRALHEILATLSESPASQERLRIVRRFQAEFSYPVIARRFLDIYTCA